MTGRKGQEPNKWTMAKFADIGAGEEFVKGMLDVVPVLEATRIEEPTRAKVKEAILAILIGGLMPAFLELRQIRDSAGKPLPLLDQWQPYEDLARKLWNAYSDLAQKTARLMGFKIGFLFDDEKTFRDGLKEFRQANPTLKEGFDSFLEQTRERWQNDLAKFRNTWLEHKRSDRKKFAKFYTPTYAEELFNATWNTIVIILAALLELRLPPGMHLIEQSPDDPNPKWAQRFRYTLPFKLE
jgi:hypothetical protein